MPPKFMCEFCNRDKTKIAEIKDKIRSRPCNKGKESKRQRDWYEANRERKIQSVLARIREQQKEQI